MLLIHNVIKIKCILTLNQHYTEHANRIKCAFQAISKWSEHIQHGTVRHLRTAGQGHIMTNDALEMISCNEFSYSHGSVTLLGTSHAIFHACWVLVLFILIIVYIKS